jgi:hypothetical protein
LVSLSLFTESGSGVSVGLLVKGTVRGVLLFSLLRTRIGFLAVISGEMSPAEAALRRRSSRSRPGSGQFLEGGKAGLVEGGRLRTNPRERAMQDEIEELKAAPG